MNKAEGLSLFYLTLAIWVLQLVAAALKVAGVVSWSWWTVLNPAWLLIIVFVVLILAIRKR